MIKIGKLLIILHHKLKYIIFFGWSMSVVLLAAIVLSNFPSLVFAFSTFYGTILISNIFPLYQNNKQFIKENEVEDIVSKNSKLELTLEKHQQLQQKVSSAIRQSNQSIIELTSFFQRHHRLTREIGQFYYDQTNNTEVTADNSKPTNEATKSQQITQQIGSNTIEANISAEPIHNKQAGKNY